MRCLDCYFIIVIPDTINGKAGEAGAIRRKEAQAMLPGTEITTTFRCNRCGANYKQVTTMVSKTANPTKVESETDIERTRGWKS